MGGSAEFAHGDERDGFRARAQVSPEGGDGVGKVAQAVGELAVDAALVLVRIPATDIGEGGLDTEIGLEQLRNLHQVFGEGAAGVLCAGVGLVVGRIGGAEHFDGFEC